MPVYTVTGAFYARRGYWQSFTKEHEADTEATAREWALSEIGGCHHVKRHEIRVDSISEASSA